MSVDPVDDCTFWYANMYFPVQGANWVTRIGAFKFPSCGAAPTLTNTLTSLSSSPNPSVFGQAVTFTATVTISGGGAGTPTGLVTFFDNGASIGSGSLNGSGQATLAASSLAVGSHTEITATYNGDANFNGSTSSAYTHTVNKANTTTSVTSTPNPSAFGQLVTFTATVTISGAGAGTPTGTVAFFDGGTPIGVGSLNVGGQATITLASLAVGAHTAITVTHSGNANFAGSTSSAYAHTVNKANTTTSVTSASNPSQFGQTVTFTATVAISSAGAGTLTGAVTFFDNGSSIGAGSVNVSGQALLTTSALSAGIHTPITATYSGDANFTDSMSSVYTHTVTKANTTTSVTSAPNPSQFGQVVTFTVTVAAAAPGSGTPTGVVTFTIDGSTASTSTLNSGVATFATSSLPIGTHPVTVTYGGSANFTGGVGALIPNQVVVNQYLLYLPVILR